MNNCQANTKYQVGSAAKVASTTRTKSVVIYFVYPEKVHGALTKRHGKTMIGN